MPGSTDVRDCVLGFPSIWRARALPAGEYFFVLGAAGGAIGALAAYAAIAFAKLNFTMEGVSIGVTSSASVTAIGILLATALGAVAGLAPAWTASRREIVQGFRTA